MSTSVVILYSDSQRFSASHRSDSLFRARTLPVRSRNLLLLYLPVDDGMGSPFSRAGPHVILRRYRDGVPNSISGVLSLITLLNGCKCNRIYLASWMECMTWYVHVYFKLLLMITLQQACILIGPGNDLELTPPPPILNILYIEPAHAKVTLQL